MSLIHLENKKLALCPKYPEESWRKTNPEIFFLPQEEVLNFQGHSVQEKVSSFLPWKVSYRNPQDTLTRVSLLKKYFGDSCENIFQNELRRIILVEIGHGVVDIYSATELKSSIEFLSAPFEAISIAPKSDIGFALASRLKASSPHEIVMKLATHSTEKPLIIVTNHLNSNFSQIYSAFKLVLSKGSQAELILIEGSSQFGMLRHSLILEENSQLTQLWLNVTAGELKSSNTLFERNVSLGENSKFIDAQIMNPQGNTRVTSNIVFSGKKAIAKSSVAVLSTQGNFDYEPIQEHKVSQGNSHLNIKMIIANRTKCVFQGLVIIDKDAPQTLAMQVNKNLLLSKNARVDASPRLEILPNDVMCKHGSATGEIDAKQLYYLTTRGFSIAEARKLIIKSFALETLSNLESESLLLNVAEHSLEIALNQLPQE
ncbi:SufD family Fe-S cluster assembly protein [Fluviispira multicolorata]|uniref:SUF system FeS cluster assembly SufBD core domain-containing protein n=1 Tax=Fluviispira multicolorata TaxID=2654512 RepID=A0A833JEU7_9BACT|nr:SufD family Fe-S cluster assembly protein [Fluviispira multicolorata]KAB8032089.1 hypothetical protein GCL57_05430 [Fluviispira multicolorata]